MVRCARCGLFIEPGQRWELDHAPGKQGYLGPSHFRCKRSHGGKIGPRSRTPASYAETPRHRRLSIWHQQGVPAREVAHRAGHSRTSESLDTYSHVMPLNELAAERLRALVVA